MKRLLVAAERLGPAGGTERFLQTIVPALAARGIEVRTVVRDELRWADEHDEPEPRATAAVRALLASFAPDAVVAQNIMDAGVLEALRDAPRYAYHVHDHRPFCPNGDRVFPRSGRTCALPLGAPCLRHALLDGCAYGPRPRTLRLVRRRERLRDAVAAADRVVVASDDVGRNARRSGIPDARIVAIPLPLADDAYVASARPGRPGVVAFAGRIVPQKGLGDLIRALARIPPAARPRLRVLGDGPALGDALGAAARLGVAVDALGAVDAAAVRAAFDEAAAIVMPSRWAEPFGLVGIEAFARARPVVAYGAGGTSAWLRDGHNGIAVPVGDTAALAEAIARLLADEALRARLGAQARADAERFRLAPIVEALQRAYGL